VKKGQERFGIIGRGEDFDKGTILLPATHLGLKS
jgi:hypothetical protein